MGVQLLMSIFAEDPILWRWKETTYICNANGIHLNKEGATIWETILDGSMSSLSMPTCNPIDFIIGTDNDYYIVLFNNDDRGKIIKYVYYDENISSECSAELTIFSIDDNLTIRQAAIIFQNTHPDVRVNYTGTSYCRADIKKCGRQD